MLGMSLVSRMGMKWTQAMSDNVFKDEPDNFGTKMKPVCLGTGICLFAIALTVTMIAILGQVSLEISLLGDKVLGFYAVSLIKAALVPLLTVSPIWLLCS